MAYVKVPKDLSKVKTKVALNLTKRQLIGFSIAGLLGFPVYLLCKKLFKYGCFNDTDEHSRITDFVCNTL